MFRVSLIAFHCIALGSSSVVIQADSDGTNPTAIVLEEQAAHSVEVRFGSLANDLAFLFNISSTSESNSVPVQAYVSFCQDTQGKPFISELQSTTTKFLRSEDLLRLKLDTKCPGTVDPLYEPPDHSPQRLYLTLLSAHPAQGTLAVIEISNSSSEGTSRHKRIPALENVLFGDFSLNKGQVEIFNYRLATLDYALRIVLAMDTQSEATAYLSSCNTAKGEPVLIAGSEEYKAVTLNSSALLDLIETTKCAEDKPLIYEDPVKLSKPIYITVGSQNDNTSGAIEVRLELDDEGMDKNATSLPTGWPRLLVSQSVNLTRNETHTVGFTVESISVGLNVSVAVRRGEVILKVVGCENGTDQSIDSYKHGYYYMHFDRGEVQDLLGKANCNGDFSNASRVTREVRSAQKLTFALEGVRDVNYARIDVWNGYDVMPGTGSGESLSGAGWMPWVAFMGAFVAFLGLSILGVVYTRRRARQRHELQRKSALQRMNSDPPPERITAFELANRTWA